MGANAYLTYNLNSSLGLANETTVKLHSLSFESQKIHNEIEDQVRGLPPGSEITLVKKYILISINIHIAQPANITSSRQRAFDKLREFFYS